MYIQKRKNLINRTFGALTVIGLSDKKDLDDTDIWICQCECGTIIEMPTRDLVNERVTSCGCGL